MKRLKQQSCVIGMLLSLWGCSSQQTNTLAGLSYEAEQEPTEQAIEFKQLSHEQVREEYKELLGLFKEDHLKEQIERRIADVYMMEGVHDQNTDKPRNSYYADATEAYKQILAKYPDSPDNAEVLYQLAKAYDIEGNQEEALIMLTKLTAKHPTYPGISEAYFRKGDIHFNNQQYREAQSAYLAVIEQKNEKLDINAYYMLGWAHYKQYSYREALNAFAYVLDRLLANNVSIDALGKKEKPLVNDTIHSISLSLDKVGGANEIATIPALAKQDYVWMIYQDLGEYYLQKELFEASASTFRLYVENYNTTDKAPDLHGRLIETYITGGFARQALLEKENYVGAYGIDSSYTRNRSGFKPSVKQSLKIYLDELASHFHSKGQLHEEQLDALRKEKKKPLDKEKDSQLQASAIDSFNKAAGFYQQFVKTFASDERIDEVVFLKAEALFSAYRYPEAITDYETVAYAPVGVSAKQHAENAGYAAIIAYQKYVDGLLSGNRSPSETQAPLASTHRKVKGWQQRAVESMLMFASAFHTDTRSPAVLTSAAEYLFGLNQYERAISVSVDLIAKNAALDKTLKKTAYGIIGHSYFKLEDYQNAEDSYLNQRLLVDSDDDEYQQISERLAASIYKKSEKMIASSEQVAAIDQLLKIKRLTPDSPIRVTAQYDAATLLLDLERWDEAISELVELNTLYPESELSIEFPRKLAFAYEKNNQWAEAAAEYLLLNENDPDGDVQREALFLAATMFEQNLNYSTAINHFTRYANTYPAPFDSHMEALYHLVLNHEKINDQEGRNSWLTQIIEADKTGGAQRTERSQWLGAWANAQYGDYFAQQFSLTQLSQPIAKSVPQKNTWLQNASERYQLAAEYGILEFITLSSYKIGLLYRQFANELRTTPGPDGLSEGDQTIYAQIIEEQAAPFDQLAVELHQANIQRAWDGAFNEWIDKSFDEMKVLSPERFNKNELIVSYGDGIR